VVVDDLRLPAHLAEVVARIDQLENCKVVVVVLRRARDGGPQGLRRRWRRLLYDAYRAGDRRLFGPRDDPLRPVRISLSSAETVNNPSDGGLSIIT
jgi:hypothetical protein